MDRVGYIFKGTWVLVIVTSLGAIGVAACDQELEAADLGDMERAIEPMDSDPSPVVEDDLVDEVDDPVPITGVQKMCGVFVGGDWHDTIVVPQAWTSSDCNGFRASIGALSYHLGCLTNATYYWGPVGGADPNPNPCGW